VLIGTDPANGSDLRSLGLQRSRQHDAGRSSVLPGACDSKAGAEARTHKTSPAGLPDPAYLYACSLRWHEEREASAGWELVHALSSADPRTRTIAASLLAKTENARIPVQAVRKAGRAAANFTGGVEVERSAMRTPYGLELIEACSQCRARQENWFCGLSPAGLKVLDGASHPSTYPGGALLFVEGQVARGAFMLCSGRVKLSTTSREGKILIFRIAGPGEVIGLSAVLSGQTYELTAETSRPSQVNFLDRESLLNAIENSPEFGMHASVALSREFQAAYRDIHDLVLVRSSAGKLARLLLSWTQSREKSAEGSDVRVSSSLTHEEMAQMIGSSRETVTRLLGDLKRKDLIRLDGSTLVIRDRVALEALAA
jgi:CRP/FNR family transcriptional regulator, cyclic AMP receptor protein